MKSYESDKELIQKLEYLQTSGDDEIIHISFKTAKYLVSKFREIYDMPKSLEKSTECVKKRE